MAVSGYDAFFTEPGAAAGRVCRVCGADCLEQRGLFGPTSYGQALARQGQLHDAFRCPYSDEGWHRQALDLMWERDTAGSAHCRETLDRELQAVLARRAA